jgi:hypothetical protein
MQPPVGKPSAMNISSRARVRRADRSDPAGAHTGEKNVRNLRYRPAQLLLVKPEGDPLDQVAHCVAPIMAAGAAGESAACIPRFDVDLIHPPDALHRDVQCEIANPLAEPECPAERAQKLFAMGWFEKHITGIQRQHETYSLLQPGGSKL